MKYIIGFLYAIYESFWRRWKGDGSDGKWYNHKLVKMFLNLFITFGLLCYLKSGWLIPLIATLVYQFLYWTQAIGPARDMARGGKPDEVMLKRYKEKFWNKWCEWIVPKNAWYGYFYDFMWFFFRYELPSILVSIILLNPWFLLAGLAASLSYVFGWAMEEHGKLKKLCGTELAEYLNGFFAGLLLGL